jgi:hypothetical protein
VTGFLATIIRVMRSITLELDASIGAPGPPGFAVREKCRSSVGTSRVHRIPPHVRDDRETPSSLRRDGQNAARDLPDGASGKLARRANRAQLPCADCLSGKRRGRMTLDLAAPVGEFASVLPIVAIVRNAAIEFGRATPLFSALKCEQGMQLDPRG